MVDNYEKKDMIGKGTFGEVYTVKRKSDGQLFVWKEIEYKDMEEKERHQLAQEVNIMSQLDHTNIVKYVDRIIDKANRKIYIVMEYCE